MILTEVPTDRLIDWGGWWMPYAARIAKREGCELSYLFGQAYTGDVRIFVIWDKDGRPTGAAATRILLRNDQTPIGEIYWIAGDRLNDWFGPCIEHLETILTRDYGVKGFKAITRPGFEKIAKPFGYRKTHVVLQKSVR